MEQVYFGPTWLAGLLRNLWLLFSFSPLLFSWNLVKKERKEREREKKDDFPELVLTKLMEEKWRKKRRKKDKSGSDLRSTRGSFTLATVIACWESIILCVEHTDSNLYSSFFTFFFLFPSQMPPKFWVTIRSKRTRRGRKGRVRESEKFNQQNIIQKITSGP